MLRLLRLLKKVGYRRGLLGGNRDWLFVWMVAGALFRARQKAKAPPKLLHREVLTRGESVRISVIDP